MRICTKCYKKLYHKRFTPYDYVPSAKVGEYVSVCCGAPAPEINGRHYAKTVRELEEKKRLRAWQGASA